MDRSIFQIIRAWVFRRDKRHGRKIVKENYFPSGRSYTYKGRAYQNNWILVGQTKEKGGTVQENFLPKLSWIESEKFVKVKGTVSPYAGDVYWALRNKKYGAFNTRERKLLQIQKGLCPVCNTSLQDTNVEIDHIVPRASGGKDNYKNWQLLHKHCHVLKTQQDRKNIAVLKSRAG
jgi:RNA-directed DNA polymerase